jgi:site-specific recombinase XerC
MMWRLYHPPIRGSSKVEKDKTDFRRMGLIFTARLYYSARANQPARDGAAKVAGGARREVDTAQLFVGKRDTLTQNAVQCQTAELSHRAKVDLPSHVLRHTFARNLVNADISLEKVAALPGHSRLNTTRLYTLPGWAELAGAREVLEN